MKISVDKSKSTGQNVRIVTLDVPLYIKKRYIVACCNDVLSKTNVLLRIGVFHLALPFIGCICNIMVGSGLDDICSLMNDPGSVKKMLCGSLMI